MWWTLDILLLSCSTHYLISLDLVIMIWILKWMYIVIFGAYRFDLWSVITCTVIQNLHTACEIVNSLWPILLTWFNFNPSTLHWRHNDHDGVSNYQPHGCLLNRLFRRRSKKTSKLRVTGLCVGNSPGQVNSPHKGPVTRKMFPFDGVIMVDK